MRSKARFTCSTSCVFKLNHRGLSLKGEGDVVGLVESLSKRRVFNIDLLSAEDNKNPFCVLTVTSEMSPRE